MCTLCGRDFPLYVADICFKCDRLDAAESDAEKNRILVRDSKTAVYVTDLDFIIRPYPSAKAVVSSSLTWSEAIATLA